eukprot:1513478-Alexandrium_andersonii.AAC.1
MFVRHGAEHTPPELWVPIMNPFLGPRSSSFERLKRVRILWDRRPRAAPKGQQPLGRAAPE